MVNRLILATVGIILLFGYIGKYFEDDIKQPNIPFTDSFNPIGYSLLLIGFVGIISLPFLYQSSRSPLYIGGSIVLSCSSFFVGLYHIRCNSLSSLSQVVEITGISLGMYFSVVFIPAIRKPLIEIVTTHTHIILSYWHSVSIQEGPEFGYQSEIVFLNTDPTMITYIDIACTGIGAFAVVSGIIYQIDRSAMYRFGLLLISGCIIYVANIVRNVFVAIAFAEQWFAGLFFEEWISQNTADTELVSFVVAETYISQIGTAIFIGAIMYYIILHTTLLETTFENVTSDITQIETTLKQYREELI